MRQLIKNTTDKEGLSKGGYLTVKTTFTRLIAFIIVLILALTSIPIVLMADDAADASNYVVMVNGETGYTTLQEALESAGDGDVLTMMQNIFLAGPVPVNVPWGTITLDLGGCTICLYDEAENAMGEGGDADTGSGGVFVLESGTLVVLDEIMGAPQRGTIQSTNESWPIFWLEGDNGETSLQIGGGAYRTTDADCIGIDENYADATVSISGGNFDKQQPEEYMAEGYGQVIQEDGTYEVEQVTTFTITWQNWDGTVLETDDVNEGDTPQYYGDTPTRPEDDDYTYEFAGWDQEIVPAEDNAVYTAVYNANPKVITYTITWQNWDGTVLETDDVNQGDTPQYYGDTPTRPEDDSYTYEFAGWDQDIVPAVDNAVYTAIYNANPKVVTYTITWQNWDGTVLETDNVNQGDTPQYYGDTPTRPEDDSNTYAFAGWDQEIVPAADNAVYTAVYNATPKPTQAQTDTIIWQNWDGSQLEADTVTEGEVPLYAGVQPARPDDANYTYQFVGWSPAIGPATGNTIYTATYNAVPKTAQVYTITWKNWDGTVLQTSKAQQGTVPAYSGTTPVKPEDSQYTYTFTGWQPQVTAASADATYTAVYKAEPTGTDPKGVCILFTSDVHCGIDEGFGYVGLQQVRDVLDEQGYVTLLVDDGDFIQGEAIGTLTKGEELIDLMNDLKYDAATIGNHEFDYGMDQFFTLMDEVEFPIVDCNFNKEGELLFPPYVILEAGGLRIAFVGITTPMTLTTSTPTTFENENGEFIYDFMNDDTGEKLYDAVQQAVDAARAEGVDYVYALAHLGLDESCSPWTYADVIANTNGIDVFLDGHSHDTEQLVVKNKDGEDVPRSAPGTKLNCIGYSYISLEDGSIKTNVWSWPNDDCAADLLGVENSISPEVDSAMQALQEKLGQVIATTSVELTVNDPVATDDSGEPVRMVRRAETNLADLCTDAFKEILGSDIAILNGGAIRTSIAEGDITYGDILNVFPFENQCSVIEATGQQILDALEWGARSVPDENGGFLQVAGLTYEIDTSIESSCTYDDDEMFTGVSGDRRVQNAMVGDNPIDPDQTYTVGSIDYVIIEDGDGQTAFDGCTVVKSMVMVDNQLLIQYITNNLGGTVGDDYEDLTGQGRINILE